MDSPHLQGQWEATIDGKTGAAVLHLGPHPEWAGTVKGEVVRAGQRHPMVGDVDQGNVTLEESSNGTNITATWMGTVTDGSCAREVRGQLQEGDEGPTHTFILRKRAH